MEEAPRPTSAGVGQGDSGGNVRDPYGVGGMSNARDPYSAGNPTEASASGMGSGIDPYIAARQQTATRTMAPPAPSQGRSRLPAAAPTDDELLAEYGAGSAAPSAAGSANLYEQTPYTSSDPYSTEGPVLSPEEEEIQAIKYDIRNAKQESLSSTRNALRLAREAEETGSNTMMKLGEQSDKIGDTERSLDVAKAHTSRAEDNARQIARLNQSIFRPHFTWNKRKKREEAELRALQRHIEEREERELTRAEMLSSQRLVDDSIEKGAFRKLRNKLSNNEPMEALDPKAQRERFQFEATQSDDELEDELDSNLDEISKLSARMNVLGRAMGQEVENQNMRIGRVSDKTTALDTRVYAGTQRLKNL